MPAHLKMSVEASRYCGKWKGVGGIAEDNDWIILEGGFNLPDGTWQAVPPPPAAEVVRCPPSCTEQVAAPRFDATDVCVANIDTLTAALVLGDACALSFANPDVPGGRYRHGGRAQEEDLCRLLPQLYPTLAAAEYPIAPEAAMLSRGLLAVRQPGSYERCASLGGCTVISAAMPCGIADRRPRGGWSGSPWADEATLRIRAVLHAAIHAGHPNLVLGAFGCGAFGNPAAPVAVIFREQLASLEFRGAFACVVFAVFDPLGTGNLGPFRRELGSSSQWPGGRTVGKSGPLGCEAATNVPASAEQPDEVQQ